MSAPEIIHRLVQRFAEHHDTYTSGKYNETQLRREFLDPFFEALGWDVFNTQGYAEMYKDVVHEDSLEIEGGNKAPDYAFRVGGQRKFFVEAKKPAVKIETNIHPAYQLRRYAWSAKLPLSILTDFEELAVYDCRVKPDKKDKASVGRVKLYSFREYAETWDEIAAVFSREAVLKGSFDAFAEGARLKKGTAEVDDAFLAEIERWRELLAKNIALRNPSLTVRELNYAVQMTIDRIVFLRICEDRGVERDEQLKEIGSGKGVYEALCLLFQRADARYNSGLFHFKDEKDASSPADTLTPTIQIDDKPLQDILKNLYYPESPYVFREIPADILGQVYERFLGKVIRLTPARQAKVEEKPEVRKAGGVYYTPTYIVDYIVANTVGKLLDGKTPKEAERLRILDPACGSGTFPLGAYQYLLDWHLTWYMEHEPEKWAGGKKPAIFHTKEGYKLTTSRKKEILLNNIFGVDIDPQAVEVTKLSLLLKVLEGESHETIGSQLALFQERVLPDLGRNIKCGNSLIGPDYYEGRQLTMLIDEEERYRVNAFDWKAEFPEVFIRGGFDAVIGNPPWGAELSFEQKDYLMKKFSDVHMRTPDSFNYFTLHGFRLLRNGGFLGFIIPNNFLFQHEYARARQFYSTNARIIEAINFGDGVFKVTAPSCLLVIQSEQSAKYEIGIADLRNVERSLLPQFLAPNNVINVDDILQSPDYIIPMDINANKIIIKILKEIPSLLGDFCDEVAAGIGTGGDQIFRIKDEDAKSLSIEEDLLHPVLVGREMNSYFLPKRTEHSIIYSTKTVTPKTHPKTLEYLKPFQGKLSQKREAKKGLIPWWSLHWPRYPDLFNAPKIVLRQTANSLFATVDDVGYYCLNSIIIVKPKDKILINYLVGLFNSKLLRWLYRNLTQEQNRTFAEVKPVNLRKLPIRPINFSDPADKARHEKMVSLVERMLELTPLLSPQMGGRGRTPQEQDMIRREIESTDRMIDHLVYELYGLTDEEIRIVEGT